MDLTAFKKDFVNEILDISELDDEIMKYFFTGFRNY